jgi:site-specific recombinase XerD
MINRQNWLDARAYLQHMDRRAGKHPSTIHKYRTQLRHLLEWADEHPFQKARDIDPAFPTYLVTARADGRLSPLSYPTIYKTLITVRSFFRFARLEWPQRYHRISESWIDLLQPARESKPVPQLEEHRFYTLDEVRNIAAVSTETLREERAKVAVAMLFLSGMRPDALASIPIACVDLPRKRILQIPQMGVRTKNNKAAVTYLLDIPELLDIIYAWDRRVRTSFVPTALWYATLATDGMQLTETTRAIVGRASVIGDDLRIICQKAGVEYKSPHKLRHGHIVYARNLAHDMAQLKAISQNVMHANVLITDQVYASLTDNQVQNVISSLGQSRSSGSRKELIMQLIEMLKSQL